MKILVTGGAGFIGSHLCERLINLGHSVVCLDNFHPFYRPEIKHHNLSGIINHPAFRLVEGDIRHTSDIDKCFTDNDIDLIIHLAAMAGVRPSLANPELYAEVNIIGTQNVLMAVRKHKVKQVIFASSSSVYGNKREGAFREDDELERPASPYAETKRAAEVLMWHWQTVLKIPIICLRLFTVYGPRQRPDLAIHKFTKLLYAGKPIPVYGDGATSRDYTYIDDTIDGFIKAMEYAEGHPDFEIFNLGESQTINLLDMIETLQKASGKAASLDWQPAQPGDVAYTCADLEKSRNLLGYDPSCSFEQGIRHFLDWFELSLN
jgi:UDP-glucuronate 4-epimerase